MRRIICLVGPTCSGKSTLEQELNRRGVPSIVSYTTRTQRSHEEHGVHYYFVSRAKVSELEQAGKVVQKVEFAGNLYGSTTLAIESAFAKSDTAVIVVEPTGVRQFQAYAESHADVEVEAVYITNSLNTLIARCLTRFRDDTNANVDYYAQRIADIQDQHQNWPYYLHYWNTIIDEMDDAVPEKSVAAVADRILGPMPS